MAEDVDDWLGLFVYEAVTDPLPEAIADEVIVTETVPERLEVTDGEDDKEADTVIETVGDSDEE